ncbi:MAG TPA: 2-oxo acid dehydrogenase subunit E2 [Streptosporangiaceae bacterium]
MTDLVIPTLNSTDDSYVLIEWLVEDGATVAAGDPVALIETSKAVTELEAAQAGVLTGQRPAMSRCRPGESVATLAQPGDTPPSAEQPSPGDHSLAAQQSSAGQQRPAGTQPSLGGQATLMGAADPGADGPVITRAAQELLDRHGLGPEAVAGLGRPLIRSSDVAALVAARQQMPVPGPAQPATLARPPAQSPAEPPAPAQPQPAAPRPPEPGPGAADPGIQLSPHQRAVAQVVSRSHATIPAAFTLIKVDAGPLQSRLRSEGKLTGGFVGMTEVVICALAAACREFPGCLVQVADDLTLTRAESVDIGVTIDVGTGLYLPVIRAADTLGIGAIARQLMTMRTRGLRRKITENDLAGARITIALNSERGIVFSQPVIYPGQVCTVSLGAVDTELVPGPAGEPAVRDYVYLGLAYDHRVINGREAAAFLCSIRDRLEAPASAPGEPAPPSQRLPAQPGQPGQLGRSARASEAGQSAPAGWPGRPALASAPGPSAQASAPGVSAQAPTSNGSRGTG